MRPSSNRAKRASTFDSQKLCIYFLVISFSFCWFLAVAKVFLLEKSRVQRLAQLLHKETQQVPDKPSNELIYNIESPSHERVVVGMPEVVEFLQSSPKSPESRQINTQKLSVLNWPPVLQDGTIPLRDGSEIMSLTGLKVPKFWSPDESTPLEQQGTKVNGQETIFLMIASYRDFQCRETITSAFANADHPEALYVGAVDQISEGDTSCTTLDIPCDQDPSQMICKYRDQISVYTMAAEMATGPVPARHIGDRMYRGQYYVMQMDAHCQFVKHWDTSLIEQWRQTHNEMAVLSTYLTDVQGSINKEGQSTRNTRPIMCNSAFEGAMPARYLRHGSQPEDVPPIRDMPQLQPFWAAGFSFSRGHFKVRVPYDGFQPMVFQVPYLKLL